MRRHALALFAVLTLAQAQAAAHEPVAAVDAASTAPSLELALGGAIAKPARWDLAAVRAMPAVDQQVGGKRYRGVRLWDLLGPALAGAEPPSREARSEAVRRYLVATGADGYRALFSMAELDPAFGGAPILVAYEVDGAPLGASGFVRLVVPGDAKPGRWVFRLARLDVFLLP